MRTAADEYLSQGIQITNENYMEVMTIRLSDEFEGKTVPVLALSITTSHVANFVPLWHYSYVQVGCVWITDQKYPSV